MPQVQRKPSNILVTGAAGFIASHVVDHLCVQYPEYQIVVLDKLDYCASATNVSETKQCKFVQGNILDLPLVRSLVRDYKIDTIMHFAAQSHVDMSINNPIAHTENNCLGTQYLLECAREFADQIKLFIHVSTDEVYGGEGENLDENTRFNPTNPYSASKAAAECIVNAYWNTYKLPLIVTRANNIYGPRQFPEKVIPKFILRLLRGQSCCLHGGGRALRRYLYVDDISRAFDAVLHHGELGRTYNIGSDEEFEIADVAQRIVDKLRALGKIPEGTAADENPLDIVGDRLFNDQRYHIDDSRIRAELEWAPTIDFEEGLDRTVKWYVEHPDYWPNIDAFLEPHPQVYIEPQLTESAAVLGSSPNREDYMLD